MNEPLITFTNVTYAYPPLDDTTETPQPLFSHFTADIPAGFTCLTGPNGSGKTTFMLLAGGRILPQEGTITLCGTNTAQQTTQEERNRLCSFIYQNMEFETPDTTGTLLETVLASGNNAQNGSELYTHCKKTFSLDSLLNRPLHHLSKSEMQRVLLAFSVLYGSRVIMMDEPMFAMEQTQKETALTFLTAYAHEHNVSLFLSLHELDLARKYAENVMLFYPDRTIALGTPEDVLTNEDLEKAYGVPAAMITAKENIDRNALIEQARLMNVTHD